MLPKLALVAMNTYFSVLAKVRRPSSHAVDQHPQVLLQQHDVRRLLGHVHGAVHRDAHVGGVQRRGVVDAVAHVADHVARLPQREDDALLLVRLDLGEDVRVVSPGPDSASSLMCADLRAGEDRRVRRPDLAADVSRDQPVVAGDDLER